MNLKDLTLAICSLMSISGHEGTNTEALFELVGEHFDECKTDAVGNHLFIKRAAKANAPTVLIDTHYDEIGMYVTDIREGGFLGVCSVGGLDPAIMQAAEVTVYGKETISAVIASTPPHLKSAEDEKKLKAIDELIVDTGYSKEEISEIVRVGTPVGFAPIYRELGKDTGRFAGKSFDDKACAAAAIYAICNTPREKLAANVCLLLSCHEETVRIGGVAPAAFAEKPDYAMVVDVNFARVPNTQKTDTIVMGEGISVTMSAVTDRKLTNLTLELCAEKEISHTRCASPSSTGTNSTSLNIVGEGIPVVDVGLPLKNMHTYTEVVDMKDCETLARLIEEFICSEKIAEVYAK